jgi:hypothetical protein
MALAKVAVRVCVGTAIQLGRRLTGLGPPLVRFHQARIRSGWPERLLERSPPRNPVLPFAMAVDGDGLFQEGIVEDFVPQFLVDCGGTPAVGMAVVETRA